jgi:hypothetical protein
VPEYTAAYGFSEGLAPVERPKEWLYIDKDHHPVIRIQCDWAMSFSEGLAPFVVQEKMGFIDRKGKVVVPPRFFKVFAFSEGLARVEMD